MNLICSRRKGRKAKERKAGNLEIHRTTTTIRNILNDSSLGAIRTASIATIFIQSSIYHKKVSVCVCV